MNKLVVRFDAEMREKDESEYKDYDRKSSGRNLGKL